MNRASRTARGAGRVRIVAGEWRRRFIRVEAAEGLRPTPDRVRETLFNWLEPVLIGAHVLDAFAGTGILGLEALSRGAANVTFIEKNAGLARSLSANLAELGGADRARVVTADAWRYLERAGQPQRVVFLDPPYRATAHGELCTLLQKNGWLGDDSVIYLEQELALPPPVLPEPLGLRRQKSAGRVRYMLAAPLAPDEEPVTWA